MGAGIAQWLERRTRDWKVAGSNPCWNGGRIFFSRVDFLCWLLFRYPFHPRVTTVARKKSRSFCQKCRWQVTAKTCIHLTYVPFIEPCFGIGHNLSLICQMTSEDIKHQLIIIITKDDVLRFVCLHTVDLCACICMFFFHSVVTRFESLKALYKLRVIIITCNIITCQMHGQKLIPWRLTFLSLSLNIFLSRPFLHGKLLNFRNGLCFTL